MVRWSVVSSVRTRPHNQECSSIRRNGSDKDLGRRSGVKIWVRDLSLLVLSGSCRISLVRRELILKMTNDDRRSGSTRPTPSARSPRTSTPVYTTSCIIINPSARQRREVTGAAQRVASKWSLCASPYRSMRKYNFSQTMQVYRQICQIGATI